MRGKHWVGDVNHSTYCLTSWMNQAINISLRAIFPLHSLVSLCTKILLGSASMLWLEAQSIRLYRFWNRCVINGDIWQLEADSESFVLKNQSERTEKKNSINNIDFKKMGGRGKGEELITDLFLGLQIWCNIYWHIVFLK